MSEILNSFVVENNNINFTPETNNLTLTPNAIQLNIYTAAGGSPGVSNNGQLLFNNANVIFGVANSNALGGNLRFTNLANLKINGGANAYFLQTDGTGNLTWAAGTANVSGNGTAAGANTQIQISDGAGNFTSGVGFTFDTASNLFSAPGNANIVNAVNANLVNANTISGTSGNITTFSANFVGTAFLTTVNNANVGGNLAVTGTANINVDCNVASNVYANLFVGNGYYLTSINGANVSNVANANYANFAGNSTNSNNANYANFAGNVVNASQPNITTVGTLLTLRTSEQKIALGFNSGLTNQNLYSVAIGWEAGSNAQSSQSIAIGQSAGYNQQKANAIALGYFAGYDGQGSNTIAIGALAGYNGVTSQNNNSIILNASGGNLQSDGANRFFVNPIRNANTSNLLFYNTSTSEISYDGNISNINVTGTLSVQQIKEKVTSNGTGSTGNLNFDFLTSAILFKTANATANFTLNFRGDANTTLSNVMSNNESMTGSFINTNGANAYIVNGVTVDGLTPSLIWAGGVGAGTGTNNGKDIYNFNIIKGTGSNNFTVFASRVGFS